MKATVRAVLVTVTTMAVLLTGAPAHAAAPPAAGPLPAGVLDPSRVVEIAKGVTGTVVDGLGMGEDGDAMGLLRSAATFAKGATSFADIRHLLTDNFEEAANGSADIVSELGSVATMLGDRATPILRTVSGLEIPDAAIALNWGGGVGWIQTDGTHAEVCFETAPAPGVRALVGVGTTSQLCGVQYDPLANPSHEMVAFGLLSPTGRDVISAQITVGSDAAPRIDGRGYIPVGDRWLQVDLSGITETALTLGVTLGVVPEVSAGYLSGSFGVSATISALVPTASYADIDSRLTALMSALHSDPAALTPDEAGQVIGDLVGSFGDIGVNPAIKVAASGEIGLGPGDVLGIPLAGASAWMSLELPSGQAAGTQQAARSAAVAALVSTGYRVTQAVQVAIVGAVTGRPDADLPTQAKSILASSWTGDSGVRTVLESFGDVAKGMKLQLGANIGMGSAVVSAGTASSFVPGYAADTTITGGALADAGATLLADLGDLVLSLIIPQLVETQQDEWNSAAGWSSWSAIRGKLQDVLDGIDLRLSVSVGPSLRVVVASNAGPFLDAAEGAAGGVAALAGAAIQASTDGSLRPFGEARLAAFTDGGAWAAAASKVTVGLQFGGGGAVSVAKLGIGLGQTAYADVSPVLLASLVADKDFATPDPDSPAATIGLDVVVGAKLTLGVPSANVNGTLQQSVQLALSVRTLNGDPPRIFPTAVKANGFVVLRFTGHVDDQGRPIDGSGFLALPGGGSVSVTFAGIDPATGAVRGNWTGGFAIDGRGFVGASGTLDGAGIHWKETLTLLQGVSGQFDLTLNASGALSGRADLRVSVAGALLQGTAVIAGGGYAFTGTLGIGTTPLSSVSLAITDGRAEGQARLVVSDRLDAHMDLRYADGRWTGEATTGQVSASEGTTVANIGAEGKLKGTVTVRLDTGRSGAALYATFTGEVCGYIHYLVGTDSSCSNISINTGEIRPGGKVGFSVDVPLLPKALTIKFTLHSFGSPSHNGSAGEASTSYAQAPAHRTSAAALLVGGSPVDAGDPSPVVPVSATTTSTTLTVTPAAGGQQVAIVDPGTASPTTATAAAPLATTAALATTTQSATVPLRYGDNPVGILVVSGDGRTQSLYVVTVRRASLADTRAPDVTVTVSPAANAAGWRRTFADIRIAVSDPDQPGSPASGVASVLARVDGGSWLNASSGVIVSASGSHVVDYRATDVAGNVRAGTVPVKIDRTPPRSMLELPDANAAGWYRATVDGSITATDDLSGVALSQWRLDGGSWTGGASPRVSTEGKHVLRYRSRDVAGNVEEDHLRNVWVDTTAPTVTLKQSPGANSDGWNNTPIDVTATATDALSGVGRLETRTDGGDWSPATGASRTVTLSTEGVHTVAARGTDVADNTSAATSHTTRIDLTDPTTTVRQDPEPNGAGWVTGPMTVTLTGADALSGVKRTQYSIDGAAWRQYGEPFTVTAEGRSVIRYRSVDLAGNVEAAHTLVVLIDTAPPQVLVGQDPVANAAGWNNTAVTVTATASDDGSGVELFRTRTDGGSWVTASGTLVTVPFTTEGIHTVDAWARDVAGNVSETVAHTTRIDLTDPWTTATADPTWNEHGWLAGPTDVTLVGHDALSGVAKVEYAVGDGDWLTYTDPVHVAAEGVTYLHYRSVDVAGNVEDTHTMVLRIDTIAPELRVGLDPRSDAPRVTGVDDGSGIDPDLSPRVVSSEPARDSALVGDLGLEGLPATAQVLTVEVVDLAGNSARVVVVVSGSGAQARLQVLAWSRTTLLGTVDYSPPSNELSSTSGMFSTAHQLARWGEKPQQSLRGELVEFVTHDDTFTAVDAGAGVASPQMVR